MVLALRFQYTKYSSRIHITICQLVYYFQANLIITNFNNNFSVRINGSHVKTHRIETFIYKLKTVDF